jgi:DNA polymerase III subunit delta
MALNAAQFEQRLQQDALAPVWLIASGEPLLLLEAADALRQRARALGYAEREVFDVDARFDWDAVDASFAALSLFSSRRLVELRLPTGKPGKDGGEVIERFCASPAPDVLLLVLAAEWSGKHEAGWSRAIDRAGQTLVLWPPKPHELPAWIARRLRSRGVDATPDAAAVLAARIEGNLLAAAQEIDKLALLKGPGRGDATHPRIGSGAGSAPRDATATTIDADEMEALVADSARYDVFRLTDTALAGEAARALHMLAGLRGEGEQVVPLLSWLASQVQILAQLSAVQEAGGNLVQAMNQARLWESKQGLFKRALARGSAGHFQRLLSHCARIDRISKGRADGDAWRELERLVVGIAAPRVALG